MRHSPVLRRRPRPGAAARRERRRRAPGHRWCGSPTCPGAGSASHIPARGRRTRTRPGSVNRPSARSRSSRGRRTGFAAGNPRRGRGEDERRACCRQPLDAAVVGDGRDAEAAGDRPGAQGRPTRRRHLGDQRATTAGHGHEPLGMALPRGAGAAEDHPGRSPHRECSPRQETPSKSAAPTTAIPRDLMVSSSAAWYLPAYPPRRLGCHAMPICGHIAGFPHQELPEPLKSYVCPADRKGSDPPSGPLRHFASHKKGSANVQEHEAVGRPRHHRRRRRRRRRRLCVHGEQHHRRRRPGRCRSRDHRRLHRRERPLHPGFGRPLDVVVRGLRPLRRCHSGAGQARRQLGRRAPEQRLDDCTQGASTIQHVSPWHVHCELPGVDSNLDTLTVAASR